MTSREARRAAEAAAEVAREAARLTQEQLDALATRIVAEGGKPRRVYSILAETAYLFVTSHPHCEHPHRPMTGRLADGRGWLVESKNPWTGYHLVVG